MSYRHDLAQNWQFGKIIATTDGTTALVAAPAANEQLVVQAIVICVTTAAAQAFTVGDGTITLFAGPASLAVNTYGVDFGPYGKALTAGTALSYTATAGVGLTISGFGYIRNAQSGG